MGNLNGELLQVEPQELQFPFELRKQVTCSMQLINKSEKNVAFKVKTTNPKKYCVRPNTGIVLPHSTSSVTVTMQAQKEAPPDMHCTDKFLVQSVETNESASTNDLPPNMVNSATSVFNCTPMSLGEAPQFCEFYKEEGRNVEEFKLKVSYIAPLQPPSPVKEGMGSKEDSSLSGSVSENGNLSTNEFSFTTFGKLLAEPQVSRSIGQPQDISSEVKALVAKLTEEKKSIIEERNKLQQELEVLKGGSKKEGGGVSFMYVMIIGLLGILTGFIFKRT